MPEITTNHAITYTNNIASPPTQTFLRVPHAFLPHFGYQGLCEKPKECLRTVEANPCHPLQQKTGNSFNAV